MIRPAVAVSAVDDEAMLFFDGALTNAMSADLLDAMWERSQATPLRLAIITGAHALRQRADRDWSSFCRWGAFA